MSRHRGLTLALALVAPAVVAEPRLGMDVVPVFEAVRLRLDPAHSDYSGSVRVELKVLRRTQSFRFHARGQKFERVQLTQGGAPLASRQEQGDEQVTLTPGRALEPGDYQLEIEFTSTVGTQLEGLYRSEHGGVPHLFTQFEPNDARGAFPCWDEPSFKQPWQVTLQVPDGQAAVGNTLVESESVEEGWRTVVFKRTPPLPSYLIALAVGPFEFVPIAGVSMPGRVVALKGRAAQAAFVAEVTPKILAALEAWFERPYPFDKLDLIAVPDFWPTAMENAGAITFRDDVLLFDAPATGGRERSRLIRVLAHELAHQWFGDLVTMAWWDDLWLNESFADWMADKIAAQTYPQFPFELDELRDVQRIMRQDGRMSTRPIRRRIEDASESIQGVGLAYNKGKAVLGMFEAWMGPEVFRRGVNAHLRAHEWRNAVSSDLWSALGHAASSVDVVQAMAGFIDQPGFPLVTVEVLAGGRLQLTQRRFANQGGEPSAQRWSIPMVLKYSDGTDTRTRSYLLDQRDAIVTLPVKTVAWVMPNEGGRGYYRFKLSRDLSARLTAQASTALDVRERIAFLGNAEALLGAGLLSGDRYLATLEAFLGDPQADVAAFALDSLESARRPLVKEDSRADFARWVRRALGPALERIGMLPRSGEAEGVALLRPELLRFLGREGRDERVLAQARIWADAYRHQPAELDPALVEVALQLAALSGDRALFDDYRQHLERATSDAERHHYLSALGCFGSPELQEAALQYMLDSRLHLEDLFAVPVCATHTEAGAERTFTWLRHNVERVQSQLPAQALAGLQRLAIGGCSLERLERARQLFSVPMPSRAGGRRGGFDALAEQVHDCAGLRAREGATVARYLAAQASTAP